MGQASSSLSSRRRRSSRARSTSTRLRSSFPRLLFGGSRFRSRISQLFSHMNFGSSRSSPSPASEQILRASPFPRLPGVRQGETTEDLLARILTYCADMASEDAAGANRPWTAESSDFLSNTDRGHEGLGNAMVRLLRVLSPNSQPSTPNPELEEPAREPRSFFRVFRLDRPLDQQHSNQARSEFLENQVLEEPSTNVPVIVVSINPGGSDSPSAESTNSDTQAWQVYILGGSYPPEHPLLELAADPSLMRLSTSQNYEDLLRLAQIIGPAKPFTVTPEQIQQSGLLEVKARIITSSDTLPPPSLIHSSPPPIPPRLQVLQGKWLSPQQEELAVNEEASEIEIYEKETCMICLECYENDDWLRLLTCGHAFHRDCTDRWLCEGANRCPACRAKAISV